MSVSGTKAGGTLVVRDRSSSPPARRPTLANTAVVHKRSTAHTRVFQSGESLGSYRLLRLLGEGSVGRVYLAVHEKLGRKVALKVLRSELAEDRRLIARFFAEARAVNEIDHANIVRITDFVEGEGHPPFYIMDLLEGLTLEQLLDRDVILDTQLALDLTRQLLDALDAAHRKGIVHRDVKPANIFLCPRETGGYDLKLLDFGVAKLMRSSTDDTSVGVVLGTPDYMSPEATYGLATDHRADLYAVGVLLFEMLVGERPFRAETIAEMLEAHRSTAPPKPSALWSLRDGVAVDLEALILALLHKRPDDRPASTGVVRDRVAALAKRSGEKNNTRVWGLVAALALLAATIAGGLWWLRDQTRSDDTVVQIAPVPPSAAPAAAAPDETMELVVTSAPSSAAVRGPDGADLGRTPLIWRVDKAELPLEVEVRLEGHASVRRTLDADIKLTHVDLEALAPPEAEAKPRRTKKKSGRNRDQPEESTARATPAPAQPVEDTSSRISPAETLDPFGGSR